VPAHHHRAPLDGAEHSAIAVARSDSAKLPVEGVIAEISDIPGVARALPIPLRHSFAEAREGEAA